LKNLAKHKGVWYNIIAFVAPLHPACNGFRPILLAQGRADLLIVFDVFLCLKTIE
jgi:hypothetical protein